MNGSCNPLNYLFKVVYRSCKSKYGHLYQVLVSVYQVLPSKYTTHSLIEVGCCGHSEAVGP